MRLFLVLVFLAAASIPGWAKTIHVPGDFDKIQDAINASDHGDTVLVAPGSYIEHLTFKGKAITVRGDKGPLVTFIEGDTSGESGVVFQGQEKRDSVLEGFTLRCFNTLYYGGAIVCDKDSSPTIRNNIITRNLATLCSGGGITCLQSSPLITGNVIARNQAYVGEGGGIYCSGSAPEIVNNMIYGNEAIEDKGGVGGGICCVDKSTPLIMNNIINANLSYGVGGGICCLDSSPRIINNALCGNVISGYIYGKGGGIYANYYSSPVIINCTISDNVVTGTTSGVGGGIAAWDGTTLFIRNTILWNNQARQGPEIWMGSGQYPSRLEIRHSDLKGGQANIYTYPGCTIVWGPGMMDLDPVLVTGPGGFRYLSQIAAGQPTDSPCVDGGDASVSSLGLDLYWTRNDKAPDIGIVDMGFHYFPLAAFSLLADFHGLQTSIGGRIRFLLDAGKKNARRYYMMLGSDLGTSPGISLPGGKATLPLVWSPLTNIILDNINSHDFSNFVGILDDQGRARASLNVPRPIPGFFWVNMHFAYALVDPWDFASNPVKVLILP